MGVNQRSPQLGIIPAAGNILMGIDFGGGIKT